MSEESITQQTPMQEPIDGSAIAENEWAEEPFEELPRRPRRRFLGVGGNPSQMALLGVLLIACGFIAGVLVEKSQTSSGSSNATAGLASRFAALRGGSTGASGRSSGLTAGTGAGGLSSTGTAGSASNGFPGRSGASSGGATAGQVSYLSGNTLYVTTAEGNTVKVTPAPGATVTKTVTATVRSIHPGETVVVSGAAGTNGAISAESIRVGASTGGGLGALFGGGSGTGGGARGGSSGSGSSGPALFGNGG
jgi:hypothetical protein